MMKKQKLQEKKTENKKEKVTKAEKREQRSSKGHPKVILSVVLKASD